MGSAAVTGENVNDVEDALLNNNDGNNNNASDLFENLLNIDTDLWEEEILNNADCCSYTQITNEVQRTMESVVLGLENGSMAQRIQAEYLRELMVRIEALEKKQ